LFTARCHAADWCNRLAEVWPWPPLWSFTEAVTTIVVREISALYPTVIVKWCQHYQHINNW
jgi:hypothetical protein